MNMNNQRFTAVKLGVASALVGTSLAACAPATMPPQQVQAANPTVTYKYRGDQELVNANANASAICTRDSGVPRTLNLSNETEGNLVVEYDCVPAPAATTVVTAPPATVVTPPGVVVAPANPLAYTYATDQELLNASANAQAYCTSRGMPRATSTVTTNSNGTRTITFRCGPA
jgi:hypothetical protein